MALLDLNHSNMDSRNLYGNCIHHSDLTIRVRVQYTPGSNFPSCLSIDYEYGLISRFDGGFATARYMYLADYFLLDCSGKDGMISMV